MEIAKIQVNGVTAQVIACKDIPAGIIGAEVSFTYEDQMWNNLRKTVVFRGCCTKDVLDAGESVIIPAEVVARSGVRLLVGVYGTDAEGDVAIPTLWANLGIVKNAADPSGDEAAAPTPPIWAQLQAMIGNLKNLKTDAKENLVAAVNELVARGGDADPAEVQRIVAEYLAANMPEVDLPAALPNPHPLHFTGAVEATYDGSKAVEVAIPQGGGGAWRKITSILTDEEVSMLIITQDDEGNTFMLEDIFFFVKALANEAKTTTSYFRFGINAKNIHEAIWQTTSGLPNTGYRWVQARFSLIDDVWTASNVLTSVNTSASFGGGYANWLNNEGKIITTPAESVVFNFMGNIGAGSEIIVYGRDSV